VHPIQTRCAFLTDNAQAPPALLRSLRADRVELVGLDGTVRTVGVHQADRLARVLERDDLCRVREQPLVMVNRQHGVLAVATGPASPPPQLAMLIVCRLEDGGVVELLSDRDDQPSWQIFALCAEPADAGRDLSP
jgi:hypothetical protein